MCFFKENPCILLDHRCEAQQEDMRIPRGERLALMDVVENTRDFAGKENFQVAKQLWKAVQDGNLYCSNIQCVCARHILDIILLSSPQKPGEVGAVSALLWKKSQRVRKDRRGERTRPRSQRLGVRVKLRRRH